MRTATTTTATATVALTFELDGSSLYVWGARGSHAVLRVSWDDDCDPVVRTAPREVSALAARAVLAVLDERPRRAVTLAVPRALAAAVWAARETGARAAH